MTYSGLLVLVICAAVGRLLFDDASLRLGRDRHAVARRSHRLDVYAERVGWCGRRRHRPVRIKDRRLLALLPVIAVLFVILSPARINARMYSMFDLNDPTTRDRVAMLREGRR